MPGSANRIDEDWRREWEEEQRLTPEEQKEADRLKALEDLQTAEILEDIRMIRREEEDKELRTRVSELRKDIFGTALEGSPEDYYDDPWGDP